YVCSTSVTDGTQWSTGFEMYEPLRMSDLGRGGLDPATYNPGPNWFKGVLQFNNRPMPDYKLSATTETNVNYYAFHMEYRIQLQVFIGPDAASPLKAPTIRSYELYRANEKAMILLLNHETRI